MSIVIGEHIINEQEKRRSPGRLVKTGLALLALGGLTGIIGRECARHERHVANKLGKQSLALQQQYPYIDDPTPSSLSKVQQHQIQREHDLISGMADHQTRQEELMVIEAGGALLALSGAGLVGVVIVGKVIDRT